MIETHSNPPTPTKKKSSLFKKVLPLLLFLLALGGVIWGAWSYNMYLSAKDEIVELSSVEGQQELAQQEIQEVIMKLEKLMKLPDDEEPVMATVTNAAELAIEQPFYKDAKDGDKVIIYQNAQKAILYNPTDDILVNVGPVYLDQEQEGAVAGEVDENGQPIGGEVNPVQPVSPTIAPKSMQPTQGSTEPMQLPVDTMMETN
jgi:hypothetical protein